MFHQTHKMKRSIKINYTQKGVRIVSRSYPISWSWRTHINE